MSETDERTALLGPRPRLRHQIEELDRVANGFEESGGSYVEIDPSQSGSYCSYTSSYIEDIFYDEPGFPPSFKKGGCVMCRTETPITTFGDLKPGDQIATRGQIFCLGLCYDHHAIVTRIDTHGDSSDIADLYVVDVDEKDIKCVGCTCKPCTCCCWQGWRLSCCKCRYPIKEHRLMDTTWQITSDTKPDPNVKTEQIRRMDYKRRRNEKTLTWIVARQFCRIVDQSDTEYCLLLQSCEHFASACVNGPETPDHDTLKKTLSIQSYSCFWRIVHGFFWLLQAFFYAIDFYVFAAFVVKDTDFYIFPPGLDEGIKQFCYNPDVCIAIFDTTCNWKFVGIFCGVVAIIFAIGLFCFYQPLYNHGFICRLCLITARLDCFSRILAVVVVETVSIYVKDPLYHEITSWNTKKIAAPLIIVLISIVGVLLIYSVSSVITWLLGMCCFPSRRGAVQFTRFFKFRGVAWLVACLARRIMKTWVTYRAPAPNIINV